MHGQQCHDENIINEVANKYKIIALNVGCSSDDLQDATNFGRYSFQGAFSADQIARGLAYYYGKIRKQEKKFYILCRTTASAMSLLKDSNTV